MRATIVVEFGAGVDSSALVVVELDNAVNLNAEGKAKTQFVPGEEPSFLVHYDRSALRISAVRSSSGMVVDQGVVSRERTKQLNFTNITDSQDLSHIPDGAVAMSWYGNAPALVQVGRSVSVADTIPAIGEATYTITADSYRLIPPPLDLAADESWPILVVVYMEAA